MSDTQVKIGNAVLKSLVELKEAKGELNFEDVGELFQSMASQIGGESSVEDFLHKEVIKIADYFTKTLNEISSINPEVDEEDDDSNLPQNISGANIELSAVVEATENATNTILDAADAIQDSLGKIEGNDEAKQEIENSITEIFGASNFQDITGQRINKVVKLLEYMEGKIQSLKTFMEEQDKIGALDEVDEQFKDKRPDADLMSGPQLDAPSQDDIDKLFAGG